MNKPLLISLLLLQFYFDASAQECNTPQTTDAEKKNPKKSKRNPRVLQKNSPNAAVTILTNDNLQKTLANGLTVVMVGADWCGWCTKMKPVFEASHATEQKHATYAFLSLGNHFRDATSPVHTLEKNYGVIQIEAIPSFLVFKDGSLIETVQGTQTQEQLAALVKKHTNVTAQSSHQENTPIATSAAQQ